ncbi:hypothetical protein [Poseidonibacter lekithochrous]|uniref:hypothetical protein n=1 Tax=Poseidonibacter lekithochrous TaxID=1904463 RepID=UPI0008FC523C|nr:hypothetical protein [Poseidonibacter lekithochrous]QKJ21866.1 hypothetical protein ALEK_0563 [Poseidonibacter lekithochrous]
MKDYQKNIISGFEFLPAFASNNYIEIYSPFAQKAKEHFSYRNLDISSLKEGSIIISLLGMSSERKKILVDEIKSFLKESRQELITSTLKKRNHTISYL